MTHVQREQAKLLNRLKRIKGQIAAIERAVEEEKECARVLQQATACRGALDGFIAEVIEDHIREHLVDPALPQGRSSRPSGRRISGNRSFLPHVIIGSHVAFARLETSHCKFDT